MGVEGRTKFGKSCGIDGPLGVTTSVLRKIRVLVFDLFVSWSKVPLPMRRVAIVLYLIRRTPNNQRANMAPSNKCGRSCCEFVWGQCCARPLGIAYHHVQLCGAAYQEEFQKKQSPLNNSASEPPQRPKHQERIYCSTYLLN